MNSQQNFLRLQRELTVTADRIGAARRGHNMKVVELNRRTEAFPSNLVTTLHRFDRPSAFDPARSETLATSIDDDTRESRPL